MAERSLVEVGSEEWMQRIQFANERERALFAEARFGETVRTFLVSDVGRYLHGRAKAQIEECQDKCLELDPDEPGFETEYRKLKADAVHAETFMRWLADALQNGELAAQQLTEENTEDLLA